MPQLRSLEDHILERIVDHIGWRILVRVDLVGHYLAFAHQLLFGKGRVECNVGNQFCRLGYVAPQYGGVNSRLLFGRIGIEFATQILQTAVDMVCSAVLRTFEQRVLGEVSQSVLVAQLVARSGIDNQRTIGYIRAHCTMYSSDSVG